MKFKTKVANTIFVLVMITLLAACSSHNETTVQIGTKAPSATPQAMSSPTPTPTPTVTKVTVGAVGDVLIHSLVYNDAKKPDGTYDFKKMFVHIKNDTLKPDFLIANQETMIGGSKLGLSTYPSFNSPQEVGDALKDMGVDFVTLANNHTLDRGEKVIQSALDYWDKIGMPYTGSYKNKQDAETIRIAEKNGIKIAVLSYTYGTNGIPVPAGKPYLVNLIDMKKIEADVAKAKTMSDVVVVAMHWGVEYQDFPNDQQKVWTQQLADLGVDIVIGNHPHVLQPPAWLTGIDGHQTFVFYSLGNLISSQKTLKQRIGGIGTIDIIKIDNDGQISIRIENPTFEPVYNVYENGHNFSIIPMKMLNETQLSQAASKMADTMKLMRTYIPDLKQN